MLTIFAENFLCALFTPWQAMQIARAEICRLLHWHSDFAGRSDPPGNSGDCLCRWWASAYRQPGIKCNGRLHWGRTDFSWVTNNDSVYIALSLGILQGMQKLSAQGESLLSSLLQTGRAEGENRSVSEKPASHCILLLLHSSGWLCLLKRSELDKRSTKVAAAGMLLHTADICCCCNASTATFTPLEDIVDQFKDSSSPEVLCPWKAWSGEKCLTEGESQKAERTKVWPQSWLWQRESSKERVAKKCWVLFFGFTNSFDIFF